MTALDTTTLPSELAEAVLTKLKNAPAPLKLADVTKGLPKPRKMKKVDLQNAVGPILDEQLRLGQVFRCPSGKNGEMRYWSRDEKHLLREKALELAATPQTRAAFSKQLKSEVKGVDPAYVESFVDELLREKSLFEHPPQKGKALLSTMPPPPSLPPLAQPKNAKVLDKLSADCQKLLTATKVSVTELLQALQQRLQPATNVAPHTPVTEPVTKPTATPLPPVEEAAPPRAELEELILKALAQAPVLSLAELRASMPAEYRGSAFDDAVLRLADEQQVILSQDAVPDHFSETERAEYVRDGAALFTTIAKWS